ncbi:carbamoyltransferase HypF [Streptantibioticus cattleyicolor]|nr:carbamoyltransferase HypF [Streptantibioticus cattleyicolor]CCB71597.1 Carbamoyltransferase hypF2 [Streptantibioticus cattleyicolor NRRL 8057 = DSM 46488]
MTAGLPERADACRRRVSVHGTVQGVGFRPFVHRLAGELRLAGFVRNGGGRVVAEVEGDPGAVAEFCRRVREEPPPLAEVRQVAIEPLEPLGARGFSIQHSQAAAGPSAPLPPDTATCDDCLAELTDPADRRHRHPFITCTHCGPRFTIAARLPYDRATTTMARFPMCADCAREYADPRDRRFHAQPIACHACGPVLRFTPADGTRAEPAEAAKALTAARRWLARGAILAVKGVGGYHLACDAADEAAVTRLRATKERGGKPFAVMCADLTAVAALAHPTPAERAALTGPGRPVVLLRRAAGAATGLAPAVCPGSPDIGVMLPYSPLHHLLFGLPPDPPGPRTLVMTSGNRSGEPIATDDADARARLTGIADAFLWHDRPIETPCDDSVVRVRADGEEVVLRRSRGYAPAPVDLPFPVPPALAFGADLKNTLCLADGRQAWLSAHLGDLGDYATLRAAEHAQRHLTALTGVRPRLLAADPHPGYHSTRRARRHAAGAGLPLLLVQHHHAHVASLMAEARLAGTAPVIGVAFDGTGYGDDHAVWGGEVLLADYTGYRRLAHLTYVPLPGGDSGVAHTRRMALAHLRAADVPWDPALPSVAACDPGELRLLERQLERGVGCVATSSMGRLFDAVSSLAGICHEAGYEAQAAVELEAAAITAWPAETGSYTFAARREATSAAIGLDAAPVVRAVVADLRAGVPAPVIAARFHRAVAAAVETVAVRAREETGAAVVALTGGVFANALLDEECARRLTAAGFPVLRHRRVPPTDGGIALGQLVVAARRSGDATTGAGHR